MSTTLSKATGRVYPLTLSVRMRRDEARVLRAAAEGRGLTRSAFVRQAILAHAIEAGRRADPAERQEREGDAQAVALKAGSVGVPGVSDPAMYRAAVVE